MMTLQEAISKRHSIRSFTEQTIDTTTISELEDFISQNTNGLIDEPIKLQIVQTSGKSNKKIKLNYGMIKNNHSYILGTALNSPISRTNYGFALEKAVLKATSLGLGSCWIGYFDNEYFSDFNIAHSEDIPALVVFGIPSDTVPFSNKLARAIVGASHRKEWDFLFFEDKPQLPLSKNFLGEYKQALEMLRLAPSAGNTQPWRVVFNRSAETFHFFKLPVSSLYEKKGLHDIDLGIALSHFDLSLQMSNISGKWHIAESNISEKGWEYMISWTKKN